MKKGTISEIFFGIFVVMKCLQSYKRKNTPDHTTGLREFMHMGLRICGLGIWGLGYDV